MNIDSIENGLVIDHIAAGKSLEIYALLQLDKLDCSVAIIKNARSGRTGRKDIIKIESAVDLDLEVLGFLDPHITVNVIQNGKIVQKKQLSLPKTIKRAARCKNPRCITSAEPFLEQLFHLTNEQTGQYRCAYCEQAFSNRATP